MTASCYNKFFISEIRKNVCGVNSNAGTTKSLMKASVLGVIVGIQKFSRKIVYHVDDGTSTLECVLWHNESTLVKKIDKLRNELDFGTSFLDQEMTATCHLLLNKVDVQEEELEYIHGDTVCCLGVVKIVKGRVLLDVNHHYKVNDFNSETLWILNVLSSHQKKKS